MRLRTIVQLVLPALVVAPPAAADDSVAAFLELAATKASDAQLLDRLPESGTPLVSGERVLFVVRSAGADPPRVLGDWNGWGEGDPGRTTMRRLAERSIWVHEATLRPDARVEYLLEVSGTERPDPLNPRTVESFSGPVSELRMPGWRADPAVDAQPSRRGRVVPFEHESAALGNRRTAFVYLPPGYDDDPGRLYPSAWIGDGGLYVEELDMPRQLDALIASGRIEPLVAIFVPPVVRRTEYTRNPLYRKMLVEELLPEVEARFHVARDAGRRAILGASRGAQAALDVALARPDLFGNVGTIAPAVSPEPLAGLFDGRPAPHGRFVLVRALYDEAFAPDTAALAAELERRDATVVEREIPEGHSRETWRQRFLQLFELVALH